MNNGEKLRKDLRVVIVAFAIFAEALSAAPVDRGMAFEVAATQSAVMSSRFDKEIIMGSSYAPVNESPTLLYNEESSHLLAYIFDLNPSGFVVVAANTDLVPVIAYSKQGSFPWDENPMNTLLHMLRKDLNLRFKALDQIPNPQMIRNHAQWDAYLSGETAPLAPGDSWPPDGQTSTGGWVESTWHQGGPYNDDCPIDPVTSDRSVVGCVATSMAQILNFWQYPDAVTFAHSDDYVTETQGISIDATTASIPSIDYNGGSPSNAVAAALSFAAGVSVEMDYTSGGSGANHWDCANAMRFDFDFTTAQWKPETDLDFYYVLEQNMKDSMPAILGISGGIGHSIVCDGFRETTADDEWHLNFGWGQSSPDPILTAWYLLPSGMPAGYTAIDDGVLNIESPRRPGSPQGLAANFSATPTSGPTGMAVSFTDLSAGNPTEWSWDFGDSRTSTTQNPTHVYDNVGDYTVSLTVRNATEEDTETKTDYIHVGTTAPPEAEFTGDPTSGNAPLTVSFTDQSTNNPTSWAWDFGDG
ncbi:C10 family peptidase, partial [candidate division WOR-3 bacterium]|nr:C10 family peptidase [candidate division WOR-3 bacterium]